MLNARPTPTRSLRRRTLAAGAVGALALAGMGVISPAGALAGIVSLPGSLFEIDTDANLTVQNTGWADWATVTESRKADVTDPKIDDSFTGGAKEDTLVPAISTGSIPPNKSDLKTFGVYLETTSDGSRFLNLFWSRVQDPSGTTNMDFELNQSGVLTANGVTPVRTSGDLLVQYDLAQGGTTPQLFLSRWLDADDAGTCEASNAKPCWGARDNLTAQGDATGSINTTTILAAASDGIGQQDPYTFGEAQLDFDAIAPPDRCISFGSAYLKSRSSDSFTAAMKDFIAPEPTNITNCGTVIIRKVTDPASNPATTAFTFTPATFLVDPGAPAAPATPAAFDLGHGQSKTYPNVLFGSGTVTETTPTNGYDLTAISCSASVGVTPTVSLADKRVSFTIDAASDVVDCTFTNTARGTIIIEKVINDGLTSPATAFAFTSDLPTTPSGGAFSLTPTGTGAAGKAARTFSSLVPGTFAVAETVPANWDLKSATCTDGSPVSAISLQAGETVTCTFTNEVQKGSLLIVKTAKHAADLVDQEIPHPGVTFTVTGGSVGTTGVTAVTGADGTVCVSGLQVSAFAGNYSVLETVPAGYSVVGTNPRTGIAVTNVQSCGTGVATATFQNMPLTDITVSVNSQVVGGTASTIQCIEAGTTPPPYLLNGVTSIAADTTWGDYSGTASNLLPGTYVCTVVVDP